MREESSYYEILVTSPYGLPPSTLCHTLSDKIPSLQIGDKGILITRSCTLRLDKSVFQFKGNLTNSRVLDPSLFNYLTNLNIERGIISERITNDTGHSILVAFINQVSGSDLVSVNAGYLGNGSSRPRAGLYESGMRIYITENTYIRLMSATGFSIARMYNVI